MAMRTKNLVTIFLPILALMVFVEVAMVGGTMEDDEKDCADQLANLASCIPFVSGTANKPTPECCENTQKVKSAKPKCLCVLIKESTDPSMGLPVNTTLALQMPSLCKIDSKISNCPALLNISPDSPDAKIFKEADASSATTDSNTPPSSSSSSTTTPSSSSSSSPSPSSDSTGSSLSTKTTPTSTSNGVAKFGGSAFMMIGLAFLALVLI